MQPDETAVDDSTDAPSSPAAAAGRAVVPSEPRPEPAGRERADVAKVLAAEGRRGGRRHVTRLILIGVAVVAVAAGLGWGWVGWQSGSTPAYVTDPATIGDIAVVLTATGELQPTREVAVSSLVTGTIATVDVDYNQPVVKGQPLAHLDPSDLDARRQRAMATVDAQGAARDAAVANVTDAQSAFERASKLGADDTVSAREVELATTALTRAKANLAAAEAQLQAAQADLASAQSDYAKATIVSPIDGVVLDINAEAGQTVGSAALASMLFMLAADLKNLELELDIDEADVPQVKVGDKADFTVEAMPDRPLTGVVRQVRSSPTVSDGVTSYKAIVAVDNSAGTLKPGMTATADIETDRVTGVLTVSNAALRFVPKTLPARPEGQRQVYVERDGQLQAVPVTTGISDGQRTAITSGGLATGDLVVTGLKVH